MEELQEAPILKEMHDTNIPSKSKQQEESSPSLEHLDDFQSSRTLAKMHDFGWSSISQQHQRCDLCLREAHASIFNCFYI
jgi:hypothetical protein